MLSLAERQAQFAAALLDPALPAPVGCPERFAVYRNNVAVGLIEALRAGFPVVDRLVGAEFFAAMARRHALQRLPASPVLLAYGGDFPAFVAAFEPAAALPYLADVARLEWLWLEAYHAAEAEPLALEDLRRVPVEQLPELRLSLHPSVRFAQFAHPALTIWRAHQQADEPGPIELGTGIERVLLVRPQAEVQALAISASAFAFLEVVRDGGTIADAVEAALAAEPACAIAELLSILFGAGACSGGAER